jgi:CheY-like chemotaxis protein
MGNKKILIVDDDPDVLQSMHVRLKANNYDTFFAADAISCMAEARKNEPDLVLLDLGLPAGDGFLVMERFKAVPSLASIPVIVISGRDHRTKLRSRLPFYRCLELGPNSGSWPRLIDSSYSNYDAEARGPSFAPHIYLLPSSLFTTTHSVV